MGHLTEVWPIVPDYGFAGGPGFNTGVVTLASGAEERNRRWENAKWRFNGGYNIKSLEQLYEIRSFYLAVGGLANTWNFTDPLDFSTASDGRSAPSNVDAIIGTGDGVTTVFQLRKFYTAGAATYDRILEQIVADTTLVAIDSVDQASGWTVNVFLGTITFTVAPAIAEIISAGCLFYNIVRFGLEIDQSFQQIYNAFTYGGTADIPLVGVTNSAHQQSLVWLGGSQDFGAITANHSLSLLDGKALVFENTSGGTLNVQLTDPDVLGNGWPDGGELFAIFSASTSTSNIDVRDHNGSLLKQLAADGSALVYLTRDAALTGTFRTH